MRYWYGSIVKLENNHIGTVDVLYEETHMTIGSKVGIVTDHNTYEVGFIKEILATAKQ